MWHKYPYTDLHETNLDMILKMIKDLTHEVEDFKVINKITFYGPWDITEQYPAWAIVDDNNNGYISLQPVPVGVPLTNADYWVMVADYSALYANITTRIVALENRVDAIEPALDDVTERVKNVDKVSNRKFLFFGDSYGETWTSGGITVTGWLDQLIPMMGLAPDQYTGSQALSGYGFLSNGNKWIDLITPLSDNDDITDIVFVGGHNDDAYVVDNPNLITFIENTIDTCRTKFKNAKIWVGFCSIETDYATKTKKCCKIYNDVASRKGCAVMNNLEYVLFNSDYIFNHAHPNTAGNEALASAIYSMLMGGGYYNGLESTTITYDADPNVQTSSHDALTYAVENDHMIIEGVPGTPETFSMFFGTGIVLNANGNTAFGFDKPNNLPLMPKAKTIRLGSTTGICTYSGTSSTCDCTLEMVYYNGYLLGYIRAIDPATRSYVVSNASNMLTSVRVAPPKFVCDLLR